LTGSSNTRVSLPKKSFYEVGATLQVQNTGGATTDGLYTWIAQNGTAAPNSLTLSPIGTSNSLVVRTFFVATATASDYIELVAWTRTGAAVALSVPSGTPVSGASATVTVREV
jgi:hypothetical protein